MPGGIYALRPGGASGVRARRRPHSAHFRHPIEISAALTRRRPPHPRKTPLAPRELALEHRAAAAAGEAVAVDLDEVDVGRLRGDALGEDGLALGRHLGDEVAGDVGRRLAGRDLRRE